MHNYALTDRLLFLLSILLFSVGPLGNLFLEDPDVGWLFSLLGVVVIFLQFTVVQEIRNNLHFVSDYLRLTDRDMKWVLDQKVADLVRLVKQAKEEKVELGLDDLFATVTYLVSRCRALDAVDIKTERWATDIRAIRYFQKCRDAAERGARISRIFVLEDSLREYLEDYINKNGESPEPLTDLRTMIRDHVEAGISDLRVVFRSQVPPTYIRDFGIFDQDAVLNENFDANGDSLFDGFFTKERSKVREFVEIYETIKRAADRNDQLMSKLFEKDQLAVVDRASHANSTPQLS